MSKSSDPRLLLRHVGGSHARLAFLTRADLSLTDLREQVQDEENDSGT